MNNKVLDSIMDFPEYARKEIRLIVKQFDITDASFHFNRNLTGTIEPPRKYVIKYKHKETHDNYERVFYFYPKCKYNNIEHSINGSFDLNNPIEVAMFENLLHRI